MNNAIPSLRAEGSFEAEVPFDSIVKKDVAYRVEAIRTIPEMQALNLDMYKLVFQPVGVPESDYQTVLTRAIDQQAAVIALTSRGNPVVYVLSTYFKSFPLVDGVQYEHLCLIVDLGAVPPSLKDRINSGIDHINAYVKSSLGIKDPKTSVGVIPTSSWVSKEQSEIWENSRQLQITEEPSDTIRIEQLTRANQSQAAYILELEAALKAK